MTYKPQEYNIESVKKYTEDVKLFRVNYGLNPNPGQFLQVSVLGFGECPLASCSHNKNNVDLLIRKAGNVTSQIFKLKKGDKVFIRGPYGNGFPIKKLKNKNLILIAGGTGIAPITSLINFIEQKRKDFKNVKIYFGFKNEDYILLKERIKEWSKKFQVEICLDKKRENNKYKQGFVNEIITKPTFDVKESLALMCGPEIMMKCVSEKLNEFGIKNNQVYWSMERRMECGMGNCGRCLIQDVYVCKDGPVFKYSFVKPKLENEESNKK